MSGFNHSFDVGIATSFGVEAACVYNHLCYWIKHNHIQGINRHKDRTWTYDTYEKLSQYMPYLSPRQIKYALNKLCEAKIVVKDNFNKDRLDQTNWYALVDESILMNSNRKDKIVRSMGQPIGQNCPIEGTELSDPLYTDTKHTYTSNYSLKVQTPSADAESAKASDEDLNSSFKENFEDVPKKKSKTTADFSEEVLEVTDLMLGELLLHKPNYVKPKNLAAMMTHLDYLLRLDKRDKDLIIKVFRWALSDSFWGNLMYKPNPAIYLREKFDQLEMKMNTPPPRKERKFAPSSNDERSMESWREFEKGAI